MAYIKDWSTFTGGWHPWYTVYGNGPSFVGGGTSGIYFDNNMSILSKDQNTYKAGTTRIHFANYLVSGAAQYGKNKVGVSVWENDSNECLAAYFTTEVLSGDLSFQLGFCTINKNTGGRTYVGDSLYTYLEIPGTTGYLDLWHSSGTWYNKVTYDGGNIGSVIFSDVDWNPVLNDPTTISHFGYQYNGGYSNVITLGTYSVDAATLPTNRYLWYSGYHNNGSNNGTVDLTSDMLQVSPIQQYMYLPSDRGIFNANVSVVLKNNSNQWADFTGYSTSGESFNPPGVFYISDSQIFSGEKVLFAGFLDYNKIQIDALNKTVTLNLNSVISQVLDKPIVPTYLINKVRGNNPSYFRGMVAAETVGEITQISPNSSGDGGTFIVGDSTMELIEGELLTVNVDDDDDRGAFKVGSVISSNPTTFSVKKIPTWVAAGDDLVRNKAYPYSNESLDGLQFYQDFFQLPLEFYSTSGNDSWGGNWLGWNIAKSSMSQALENITISPSKKLFGDEKYIDVLDDFLLAVGGGGFGAYDGNSVNILVPSPTFLLQSTESYLLCGDVEESFVATRDEPIKSIFIEYAYDEETKKYLESVNVDILDYGIDKKISTWLINYNEDARSLAYFTSAFFASGVSFSFSTNGMILISDLIGKIVQISGIPIEFEVSGSKFLVTNAIYDPSTQRAKITVVEISSLAEDYFRVDYHDIGGGMGVL